ncbi:MAG: hypothetical protein V2A79_01850 [Planctomycetota bacterium]
MIATYEGPLLPRYRRRLALGGLILAWGAQAIVTQSLLIREALVLMFGSEFAWGVVLSAWLFGVSLGALVGGRLARSGREDIRLVAVLLVLSLAACVELWVFRGARAWLGVAPGELLPLSKTAVAAMLFVSPVGALVGMAFPLACCIGSVREPDEPQLVNRGAMRLGEVYALESAGSLIGGAAFSFWAVEHLAPIQTALACGALTATAASGLLATTSRRPLAAFALLGTGVAALLAAVLGGEALNRRLVDRRWHDVAPGYTLCAEAESKYQNLTVGRRAEQFTLYCNGQVAADFPDPYTFVPLAHFWMCQHPAPRRVLVLGGGAEGLLAEVLRHPVEHVDYVEPDPRQIQIIEPYLAEQDRLALGDNRVTVHHVDARYFVKTQRDRFDLVIAHLPEPMSALRARFYTDEFYHELRRAMTPRSVLCMTVAAAPGELSPVSGGYLASVRATLQRHFPYLIVGWGDPAQVLAATDAHLVTADPATLVARYTERGVKSEWFDPVWFEGAADWLEPQKLRDRAEELDAIQTVEISTDLRPAVYLQRLVLWDRMTGGSSGRVIERLRAIRLSKLTAGLVLLGVIVLLSCRLRRKSSAGWAAGAIVFSVGSTGFATMALSIVWLFAFQNLYGYVYSRIGWIIAVFMGGLVIGCALAGRWSKPPADVAGRPWQKLWHRLPACVSAGEMPVPHRSWPLSPGAATAPARLWRGLVGVDVFLALLALSVPFLLPALGSVQDTRLAFAFVEWAVSTMVALTGVLGGAAFALAGGLQLAVTGDAARAAGSINGADHAGACLGALLTGIVLVPVFGTATTAFLLVGVKLAAAVLLIAARRVPVTPRSSSG